MCRVAGFGGVWFGGNMRISPNEGSLFGSISGRDSGVWGSIILRSPCLW